MTIAIDFETHLIDSDAPVPKPVCLSFCNGTDKGLKVGMEEMEEFLLLILDSNERIIAHNMKFEALVIYEYFPNLRKLVWKAIKQKRLYCTKIYEQLLNNVRKYQLHSLALASLVNEYFKVDISEDKKNPDAWRYRYSELEGVALKDWPKAAIDYAIGDSVWTLKLYNAQCTNKKDYGLSVAAEFSLNLMANRGILIDQERVNILEREVQEYVQPRYEKLIELGLCSKGLDGKIKKNTKIFKEYIQTNITEPILTAKGNISTTGESLKEYLKEKRDDEVINMFLELSQYEKVSSAFINNLKQANPYIRTEYNAVVSSGRTSSRKSSLYPSVNMQQMPREVKNVTWDIRNCFIPRPGYKIVAIDYNGLELASAAHQLYATLGWSKMRETINKGKSPVDMHSVLAHKLKTLSDKKECSYEKFVVHKKEKGYKEFRQLAKPINLGFPGGIGYDTMRELLLRDGVNTKLEILQKSTCEDTIKKLVLKFRPKYPSIRLKRLNKKEYALVFDELVEMKNELFKTYPDLEAFLTKRHLEFTTGKTRYIRNSYGERESEPMYAFSTLGFDRDFCTYTSFCNGYLMQSPSAIGAKKTVTEIIAQYANSKEVHPLAFIHDEIIFEIKDNGKLYTHIDNLSEKMIYYMQQTLSTVRIAVEAEVMDYWSKSGGTWAKTYWRDAHGTKLFTQE